MRDSLSIAHIEEIAKLVKQGNPDAILMVDNCYGEFVEDKEPTQVGADLIMGSLIKNPGAASPAPAATSPAAKTWWNCVPTGSPPRHRQRGWLHSGENRNMYLGLFHAPTVVASALKTAVFAASLFSLLGYEVLPKFDGHRTDIIQTVCLKDEPSLTAFCQGIQKGSPVDSFVVPEAWDMPGYESQVIMAAGAFTMGASH